MWSKNRRALHISQKTSHQKLNGYWVMNSLAENSDHAAEPSVITQYIKTCMHYEDKFPMR